MKEWLVVKFVTKVLLEPSVVVKRGINSVPTDDLATTSTSAPVLRRAHNTAITQSEVITVHVSLRITN